MCWQSAVGFLQPVAECSCKATKAAPSFRTEDGLCPWIELALGWPLMRYVGTFALHQVGLSLIQALTSSAKLCVTSIGITEITTRAFLWELESLDKCDPYCLRYEFFRAFLPPFPLNLENIFHFFALSQLPAAGSPSGSEGTLQFKVSKTCTIPLLLSYLPLLCGTQFNSRMNQMWFVWFTIKFLGT